MLFITKKVKFKPKSFIYLAKKSIRIARIELVATMTREATIESP